MMWSINEPEQLEIARLKRGVIKLKVGRDILKIRGPLRERIDELRMGSGPWDWMRGVLGLGPPLPSFAGFDAVVDLDSLPGPPSRLQARARIIVETEIQALSCG
jgi:hypothetical protein